MKALKDNKAWVKVTSPATDTTVQIITETNGYKTLIVRIDGAERMRVKHIHPKILTVDGQKC